MNEFLKPEMVHGSESNSSLQVQTKAFVVYCALGGIVPRLGEDEFRIVTKLSACQISGTRGEGFGKLRKVYHIIDPKQETWKC